MQTTKAGRNDVCPCGSGKKYKKCCELKTQQKARGNTMLLVLVAGLVIAGLAAGISSFRSERDPSSGKVWSPEHGHYH